MPHGERMDGFDTADSRPPEPVSLVWRARGGAMRFMPQTGGDRDVSWVVDAVRFVPSLRLAEDDESSACHRWLSVRVSELPGMPRLRYFSDFDVQPRYDGIPTHGRARECALRGMPHSK